MRIYLDVCCLNRPFDDQSQNRIRLEAEAILLLLKRKSSDWIWLSSPAVTAEINQTPDIERRQALFSLLQQIDETITITPEIMARVTVLEAMGFHSFDAAHVAFAETGAADIFFTTDDHLLNVAIRHANDLNIQVANPLRWLQEIEE